MLENLLASIKSNLSEVYTGLVLVIFIPLVVGFLTTVFWGLLLSFIIQAVIGVLYIRNSK